MKTNIIFLIVVIGFTPLPAQSINLISPNGGENWEANTLKVIKWESDKVKEIKIEYSLDGGLSWNIISSVDASSSQYNWTTSSTHTPYALIKISDTNNFNVFDISDAKFYLFISKENPINKKTSQTPIKIMPLGDSITWGVNPDDPDSPGYRRFLDSLLNNAGYNFEFVGDLVSGLPDDFDREHSGHPGWNAAGSSSSGNLDTALSGWLATYNPDIVLLHIGTNDLSSSRSINSGEGLANEVIALLDTIYNFNPFIITIVAQIIDRADSADRHSRTIDFNNILPDKIALLPANQQGKIRIVDTYKALGLYYGTPPGSNVNFTYGSDNLYWLHPNTYGYTEMAKVWYVKLTQILPAPAIVAPTNLLASLNSQDTTIVDLFWEDKSLNEFGFVIQRAEGDTVSATEYITIDTVAVDITAYTDSTTNDTTTYTYRIRAYNAVTVSLFSNLAEITTPLPVELILFTANVSNGHILISWITGSEINNAGFSLERSTDNISFSEIDFIKGNGTTTEISEYSFKDNPALPGKYYYRLKQVDFNGTFNYSKSIDVDPGIPEAFSLDQNYPNPFNSSTTIKFTLPVSSKATIKLFNILGEEVSNIFESELNAGVHEIIYNASAFSSGVYFYSLNVISSDGSNYNSSKRMVLIK